MKTDVFKNIGLLLLLVIFCLFIGFYGGTKTIIVNERNRTSYIPLQSSCHPTQNLGEEIYLQLCMVQGEPKIDIRHFMQLRPTYRGVSLRLIQFKLMCEYNKFNVTTNV
jgi:hypothetical protein